MRHIVIVGAGGSIGRAVAQDHATPDTRLSLVDVDEDRLAQTAATVVASGEVELLVLDAATSQGADQLALRLAERSLAIDGFVYAAGATGPVAPISTYRLEDFEEVLRINLHGPFLALSRLLPLLHKGQDPSVVFVGSTSSIRGRAGLTGYVSSKHGLLGLVRSAALDLADSSVRVNAVLPGPVEGAMLDGLQDAAHTAGIAFGRKGSAENAATAADVAAVINFLLSPQARQVRGAGWVVDGAGTVS